MPGQSCRLELMDRENAPKYFLCLMPSVKTSNQIKGILISDMESSSTKL